MRSAGLTIRRATSADSASLAEIHVASWRDAYASILTAEFLRGEIEAERVAVWSQRLNDPPASQLVDVACDPARPVGFVCSFCDFDPTWGSLIDNLHVLPDVRGRGIGEQLLRTAVEQLKARKSRLGLHLWVFEANADALRFYERLGGRVVERDRSKMAAAAGKPVLRVQPH